MVKLPGKSDVDFATYAQRFALNREARRRYIRAVFDLARGLVRGHPGVRVGRRVKLNGDGRYDLHPGSRVQNGSILYVAKGAILELATGASIGERTVVNIEAGLRIGEGSQVSWQCQLLDTDFHQIFRGDRSLRAASAPITIGDKVLVGTGAIILKGVEIGDNAIVGAGSVVSATVQANAIVAGNPAAVIGETIGWL